MFDWIIPIGAAEIFPLDAPASATVLGIVAFLSIFAAALAERAFRHQSLGVFAGLSAVLLLAALFVLGTIAHALLGMHWTQKLFSGELFFHLFCLGLSALWLATLLSPVRLLEPEPARRIFFRWQISVWGLLALVLAAGTATGYNLFHLALDEAVRQIFAGTAAGIFVIATGIAIYRLWRERAALWLGLVLASLTFSSGVSLFYFAPSLPLLGYSAFGLAALLVIAGLFADHARFLRLESELRSNLLENALKFEEENRRLAAILEFTREAVIQVDRDERVLYANPLFLQLANLNTAIAEKKLSNLLSRELYDKMAPAIQEARRGRPSHFEIQYLSANEEKALLVFATPLHDKNDKISGVHLSMLDFTPYHRARSSLQETVAQKTTEIRTLQQSLENAGEAVAITDTKNKICQANEAFERITGFARNEIIGLDLQACRGEIEASRAVEINRRLLQRKSWRGEVSGRRKDGSTYVSELMVAPIEDAEAKITHHLWIERDITDHKVLEQSLQRRTEELHVQSTEIARLKQVCDSLQEYNNDLQQRIAQLNKLMELGEDIRLKVGADLILPSLSNAVAELGWRRVLVFQHRENDIYELVACAGFANRSVPSLRQAREVPYTDFAAYMLERFRMSQSFFLDSEKLAGATRPIFVPASLPEFPAPNKSKNSGLKHDEWQADDALLVPIRARDKMLGMIAVFSPSDGRRPDLQRVRDLEILAEDSAIAIENGRVLALHQRNERQARILADISKAFRAAGTVEQVVTDIADIGAQTFELPCLVVVRPVTESGWLGAFAVTGSRGGRAKGHLLEASELSATFLARLETVKTELTAVELSGVDLPRSILDEAKVNLKDKLIAQVIPLRSRGRSLGFMSYLMPPATSVPSAWHADELAFAADLAGRAALTLENARLFHETEEKARALERANQLISEFLASVSHELRTPMHSILQYSEILLSQKPGSLNQEQQRQVKVIQHSGKNLLDLLNDILDLSKIEAGKMEAIIESFDPAQVIREAIEFIRPLCEKKNLHLRARLEEEEELPAQFVNDRSILHRVLTNLLGNAAKFTERGEIEAWARMRRNTLVVSVRDTGIGIPAARQKEIFEPFRQLESSESRRHGGTGLGLAISKKMLAIVGGEIEVKSEPGKGSTFTIHLPESTLPIHSVTRRKKERMIPHRSKKGKTEATAQTSAKQKKPGIGFPATPIRMLTRGMARAKTPRILVVEDDENTRYAMQFILENAGYRVEFAEGGEKALMAAQHHRPDLILMDIMMPNMDGYQVARLLKAQKQLAHIPVVALTARAMKGDREKALAAGCNDYLTKPFESKDILGMLEKWLGKVDGKGS